MMATTNSSKKFKVGSSSKPQEHFEIAENDRISKLPDSILCHILSFMPTRYSVQSSILSKRWIFTWTSVSILDLNDQLFEANHLPKKRRISASTKSFKNFVNTVLILRSHPRLQSFRLKLVNSYPTSDVHSWILAAITHNVEELDLSMSDEVKLPRTLFSCACIVVLKLASGIDLDVPESVSFPNLKSVHFQSLRSLCDATINRIFSGSPILGELVIRRDHQDGVKTFSIVSSSLKTLIIRNSARNGNRYKVVIDAPKLEYLEFFDERYTIVVDSIEIKNAPSLVKSTFDFSDWNCRNVDYSRKPTCSLFGIRNVKVLSSPLFMLKTLLSNLNVRFDNLTQLLVKYCRKDFPRLTQILTKLPNLEVLILYKTACCDYGTTCEASEQEMSEICCLKCSLTLKRLQLERFKGDKGDMQLLKYFVENARVLNEIRLVRPHATLKESAFLNMLLAFPMVSNAFKIIIV